MVTRFSKPLTLTLLLSSLVSLTACSALSNEGVEGAYPPPVSKTVQGGWIGSNMGVMAGGLSSTPHGAAIGAGLGTVLGGLYGHNQSTIDNLSQSLRQQGVNVVFLGEYVELVLPADMFFTVNGSELKINSYPILDKVVLLLKALGTSEQLNLVGFTDNVDLLNHRLKLSKLQAQSIATYLWTHGISKERMHVYGGADAITIANPDSIHGNAYNRRVEITLRRNNLHSDCCNLHNNTNQ